MIEQTYVLTIREAPKSVNAGGGGARLHWSQGHKEKKRWEGLVLMEMMVAKVERPMQFCKVDVTIHWPRRNHRDVENYRHPVTKPLADALVKGGYLADDTEEWFAVGEFRFDYPSEWPYGPLVKGATTIRLEASYA